jgi:hypothetical protein
MPTTVAERLKAIQDRIWAMHDALLTIRLPFETYNSLTDELRQRLRREEVESEGLAAGTSEGRAGRRGQHARSRRREPPVGSCGRSRQACTRLLVCGQYQRAAPRVGASGVPGLTNAPPSRAADIGRREPQKPGILLAMVWPLSAGVISISACPPAQCAYSVVDGPGARYGPTERPVTG